MALNIRLPELYDESNLKPWTQNFIRTLTSWMTMRPPISVGSVTLSYDPAITTTTITDRHASPDCHVDLVPTNANGAGALGTGWYVSSRPGGSVVITHQGSSLTRTYTYIIVSP